jgi:hypothetical protein
MVTHRESILNIIESFNNRMGYKQIWKVVPEFMWYYVQEDFKNPLFDNEFMTFVEKNGELDTTQSADKIITAEVSFVYDYFEFLPIN